MNPFVFLIDILFHLYILVLMLRLILQWARADFYNPVSQFIVKATNPVVVPLRRIIPGVLGIDMASLVMVLTLTAIKLSLVAWMQTPADYPIEIFISNLGFPLSILGLSFATILDTLLLTLNIFLFTIIIQALLSWINPDPYNPVVGLLNSITWPVLKHFRQIIPPISGFDISPIFAIITILFVQQLIIYLIRMFF